MAERAVLHVELNCFFVSCHVAREPGRLARRTAAVAGGPPERRGSVLAASYAALACGVRTGMPVAEARALCPSLELLGPDYGLYRQTSARALQILGRFSPLVEPFGNDAAWLDVTGRHHALGDAMAIGRAIQERLRAELGLPCSIGAAPNKLLARMASGLQEPNGLVALGRGDVPGRIWPLPVDELFGVGPRLARRLATWNIQTVGDLARVGPAFLRRRLGLVGQHLWSAANGRDDSPVDPTSLADAGSVGHSVTLPADLTRAEEVDAALLNLADQVARRARRAGLVGLRVAVTLRDDHMVGLGRSRGLPEPTDATEIVYAAGRALLHSVWQPGQRVRLVGVSLGHLVPACEAVRQPSLFDVPDPAAERPHPAEAAAGRGRGRRGEAAAVAAGLPAGRERGRAAVPERRRHRSSSEIA